MDDERRFTIDDAREAAARDELGAWVADFLASPGSDNATLGQMLSDPPRHWLGPVLLPFDQLHRLAGPADHPVLCPVDDDEWRDDVEDLAEKIDDGLQPAPVVVSARGEQLVLEDGNHRVEALRRAGHREFWGVVAFDAAEERDRFIERSEAAPTA
jgi:hypothetical protein